MKLLKLLFLFLWQLPQNIVGAICILSYSHYGTFFTADDEIVELYFKSCFGSSVSLGDTIILDNSYWELFNYYPNTALVMMIDHEHGHQIQSRILGPLYLIVIGIPSLLGNLVFRLFKINPKYYHKLPWEAWADKLGGVTRE